MAGDVPASEVDRILKGLAPELARPVHAFLHGGAPGPLQNAESDSAASFKLRVLHDALDGARHKRALLYDQSVLAVAVRLQAVILYQTMRATSVADSTAT